MLDKKLIEKLARNKKIQKSLKDLQKIVDKDDGITGTSISCGDNKVEFKKTKDLGKG